MPYTIDWYVPNRIIFVNLWGNHTIEELRQLDHDVVIRVEEGNPLVHVVTDSRKLEQVPRSLHAVVDSLNGMRHPSMGWIINVGDHSPFIKFMMIAVSRIMRIQFRLLNTMPQAFEMLKTQDETIDWTQANLAVTHEVSSEV